MWSLMRGGVDLGQADKPFMGKNHSLIRTRRTRFNHVLGDWVNGHNSCSLRNNDSKHKLKLCGHIPR